MKLPRIMVCGLGKLGSPIAAVFAASEVPVFGIDLDESKVTAIANAQAPVKETDLDEYLALPQIKKFLRATMNIEEAVSNSDACLFVTPTPSLPDGSFNHEYLLAGFTAVAREVWRQRKAKFLFVINSTVQPGFCDANLLPIIRRFSENGNFQLAYKPEFIALGTVIRDLLYPDLLLIGADSEEAGVAVEYLYREMLLGNAPAKHVTLVEAELAKISLNCAVTMKISFANQVGLVAQALNADPRKVLDAVGEDRRIGHAALKPGLPFGGPCFPRDNKMFQFVAQKVGARAPLAEATDYMNRLVLRDLVKRLPEHGDVGILGMAYKPNTPITEESAGSWWLHALRSKGRRVRTHDPMAPHSHSFEEVLDCRTVIVACACEKYGRLRVREGTVVFDPMNAVSQIEYIKNEEMEIAS